MRETTTLMINKRIKLPNCMPIILRTSLNRLRPPRATGVRQLRDMARRTRHVAVVSSASHDMRQSLGGDLLQDLSQEHLLALQPFAELVRVGTRNFRPELREVLDEHLFDTRSTSDRR